MKTEKTAVMCFGRFQPVTKAHEKLFTYMYQWKTYQYIFVSETHDTDKNPLTVEQKRAVIQNVLQTSHLGMPVLSAKDPFHALKWLSNLQTYSHIHMVCGPDRVKKYSDFKKYAGPGKEINVDELSVIEFGDDRDPYSSDIQGVSASKARQAARDGDVISFGAIAPDLPFSEVVRLYSSIRTGMGIVDGKETT
jgi:hypothetical protein